MREFNFCLKQTILKKLTAIIILYLLISSCANKRELTYFQSSSLENDIEKVDITNSYVAKIQKGDIISVVVSSLSPEASAMFNPYSSSSASNSSASSPSGYLIDEEGFISIPLIGKLKLEGLSTKLATDLITQKLEKYLQQPTVNLRILNFKISVLGEVVRPSVYTIPNEKITLPEAIGLAGDLTIYGIRTNILIIRENNGKREFTRIDMSKRDFFNSPYYNLHANDVVYIEAINSKFSGSNSTSRLLPIIISGLSLIAVLINTITQ